MSVALTNGERDLALRLRDAGLELCSATLAIVMATREHARPEPELQDILRQYSGLENQASLQSAIADLRRRSWIVEQESYGRYLVSQAPDLRHQIAVVLSDPSVEELLSTLQSSIESSIVLLGPMVDSRVYDSFIDVLRSAQHEVLIPMLATTPRMHAVNVMQERARQGVRFRLILGSPHAVGKIRGNSNVGLAHESIRGWSEICRTNPTMQLRISDSVEAMRIASSACIDGRVLRFDVYDHMRQRSLQGVMLEVESPPGFSLNIVDLFISEFESVWSSARPVGNLYAFLKIFSTFWRWILCVLFFVMAVYFDVSTTMGNVLASSSATFLVNGLASSWSDIVNIWRKLHG